MGTITAETVIGKVQIILQDITGIRWPDETELLGWLNDGQLEVMVYKPNACIDNKSIQLQGGTKQNLPPDGVQLMDVVRNMGLDGLSPGRAIRIAMRDILDAQSPNWHSMTPNPTVQHYMYDPKDPKHFYVYPPQPASGSGSVEIIYAPVPPTVPTLADVISIDDIYQNVLIDYILYRCYSKDASYAANPARASASQSAYQAALSGKTNAEMATNPNSSAPAGPHP